MLELVGWSNPGRSISDKTHEQLFGIMAYLKDKDRIGDDVWNTAMQIKIGVTVDVKKESTLRHIVSFMKVVGILYGDSLTSQRVPDVKHCVTPSGEVLYQLIKMENLAKEQEKIEVLNQVNTFYKSFYANVFLYWYVKDTKIHVARTVLNALKKFGSLNEMEWFIMNTFISETDNEEQERKVEKYIEEYRAGNFTLTKDESVKANRNAFGYWSSLLSKTGLIIKQGSKIYIGKTHKELAEFILAEGFLENLDVEERYYLEL